MSTIYRIFIRHETESQPTWFKIRSERSHEDIIKEIHEAMASPTPAIWRCRDINEQVWIFRADKIYTVCVYPPEEEIAIDEPEKIKLSDG